MLPLLHKPLSKPLIKRSSLTVMAPVKADRLTLARTGLSLYRGIRKAVRWTKKLSFFLFPPLLYDGIKLLAPRLAQAPVRQQFSEIISQRFAGPLGRIRADDIPFESFPGEIDRQIQGYRELHSLSENNLALLEAKFNKAAQIFQGQLCDRARLLRELARLAASRGQDALSCAYRAARCDCSAVTCTTICPKCIAR